MQEIIQKLENIITDYSPLLKNIGEEAFAFIPAANKWSKKEVLGHLVDSAQNNNRRFVLAQYEDLPQVLYQQDAWVKIANYQLYNTADLIALWVLLNKHICMVLKNIPAGVEKRASLTNEPHSIAWLADDYIKHLLHHLHQILDLEPIAYP